MTNDTKAFVLGVLLAEAEGRRGLLEKEYAKDPSSLFVFDECDALATLYGAAAELVKGEGQPHA